MWRPADTCDVRWACSLQRRCPCFRQAPGAESLCSRPPVAAWAWVNLPVSHSQGHWALAGRGCLSLDSRLCPLGALGDGLVSGREHFPCGRVAVLLSSRGLMAEEALGLTLSRPRPWVSERVLCLGPAAVTGSPQMWCLCTKGHVSPLWQCPSTLSHLVLATQTGTTSAPTAEQCGSLPVRLGRGASCFCSQSPDQK